MSINVKDSDKWVAVDTDYSKVAGKLASGKQIELVGDVEGMIEESYNSITSETYYGFDGSRDVQINVTYNPDSIAPAASNDSEGNLIATTYLKRSGGTIFGDIEFKLTDGAEATELTITKEGDITGHNITIDGDLVSTNISNSNNLTSKNANIDNIIVNNDINSNESFGASIGNTTPFNDLRVKKIELLTSTDIAGITLDATTGVMSIVPNVTNTGTIGTFTNYWSAGYFVNLYSNSITGGLSESISFTDINNNTVSYNGGSSLDLTSGLYYAVNAYKLSTDKTFSIINGAIGSTTSDLETGFSIDITELNASYLSGTINTNETTFDIIGNISANVATATRLETTRSIGISGVSSIPQPFDGSGDVTIPITDVPIDLLSGILPVDKGGTGTDYEEGILCFDVDDDGICFTRGCTGEYCYIVKWDETNRGVRKSYIYEDENYNVGIGIFSPTHKLDVDGNGNFNGELYLNIIDDTIARYITYIDNENEMWRLGYVKETTDDENTFVLQYNNTSYEDIIKISSVSYALEHSGNIYPKETETLTLGTVSSKYSNVYSTSFTGDLIGTAESANKLTTARDFSITGAATANSVSFDGTEDVVLTLTNIDGSYITGTIPVESIPSSVTSSLIQVNDENARFALTSDEVSTGDFVRQLDTNQIFYVIDIDNLGNENGYVEFSASGDYLSLEGGTMVGNIVLPTNGGNMSVGLTSAPLQQDTSNGSSTYYPLISQKHSNVTFNIGGTSDGEFGIYLLDDNSTDSATGLLVVDSNGDVSTTGAISATRLYNSVYNDYAECFNNSNLIYKEVLHRIVEIDDNECVKLASKNSTRVVGVVSDNYGHLLGGTESEIENNEKIPVGLAGTLYVFTLDDIDKKNIGKFVCSDNHGYATIANDISNGTIVGKIIGFNEMYHQYKILLILK